MNVLAQLTGSAPSFTAPHGGGVDLVSDEHGRLRTTNEALRGVELVDLSSTDVAFTAPTLPRWIRVTGAGVIKVDAYDRDGNVQSGILLPFSAGESQPLGCIVKIYRSGTTCTGLVVGF